MLTAPQPELFFIPQLFALPIHIIGCGGMGNRIAEGMTRMGLGQKQSPIHLYDFDFYQAHNLRNQYITRWSLGRHKVEGLTKELRRIEPSVRIHQHLMEVGHVPYEAIRGIVFLCLDSMEARKNIVWHSLMYNPNV